MRGCWLLAGVLALAGAAGDAPCAGSVTYPEVRAGTELAFPRDHGAHPDYRTEWWYVTGHLHGAGDEAVGFQVTFFRSRPGIGEASASPFAARQLLFAHVALSDPRMGRARHEQRSARVGFGLAGADEATTRVWIDDWSLALEEDRYHVRVRGTGIGLELTLRATQPILLQGENGFSRKGPLPQQASYYYSRPHLAVSGSIERDGERSMVRGEAWLDHEWSSELMAEEAQGWDWCGINLADGGALMVFRMRKADGSTLWAGGTLRDAAGRTRVLGRDEVRFEVLRRWRSPRSSADYPVQMRVGAGDLQVELRPLLDDQELDVRASVGTLYWEGAVVAERDGRVVGRGYLELTGYWKRLRL